jgi:hypothetical protein
VLSRLFFLVEYKWATPFYIDSWERDEKCQDYSCYTERKYKAQGYRLLPLAGQASQLNFNAITLLLYVHALSPPGF